MTAAPEQGFAIWLTGLPSSGKSTVARALQRRLALRGIETRRLDADSVRRWLTPDLGYSRAERDYFYEVLVDVALTLTQRGINVIIAATGSLRRYREAARQRLARFAEVYIDCDRQVCRARDPKGLWRLASQGRITTLPGAGSPYEPPTDPEVRVDTGFLSISEAATRIEHGLDLRGFYDTAAGNPIPQDYYVAGGRAGAEQASVPPGLGG